MARTFFRLWMGRMMSGLCCSSITMRLMAVFWLKSRKDVGAVKEREERKEEREREEREEERRKRNVNIECLERS